ncbi:MAG: hypothetical protein KDJ14_07170 [Xanthomonadales bacterium]|nr:hypothetical protein [Xanthomonadales bacterium]
MSHPDAAAVATRGDGGRTAPIFVHQRIHERKTDESAVTCVLRTDIKDRKA